MIDSTNVGGIYGRNIIAVGSQAIKKPLSHTRERISSPKTAFVAERVAEERRLLEVHEPWIQEMLSLYRWSYYNYSYLAVMERLLSAFNKQYNSTWQSMQTWGMIVICVTYITYHQGPHVRSGCIFPYSKKTEVIGILTSPASWQWTSRPVNRKLHR